MMSLQCDLKWSKSTWWLIKSVSQPIKTLIQIIIYSRLFLLIKLFWRNHYSYFRDDSVTESADWSADQLVHNFNHWKMIRFMPIWIARPQSLVSRSSFWDSIEQVPTVMRSWQFLNWFLSILCMMFPPSPIVSMLHTWNKSVGNIESWKIFPDLYFEPFLSYFVIFKVQISKFQIVFEKFRINKFNLVVFKRIHRRLRPQLNWSGSKQWSGPWIPNLEDKCALFQD